MKRLSDEAIELINKLHTEWLDYDSEYVPLIEAVNKLKEYEDAEEKGLLVPLPCKVGDMVYRISAEMILPAEVLQIGNNGIEWYVIVSGAVYISFSDFGKTAFLTPEAAQQALKERDS